MQSPPLSIIIPSRDRLGSLRRTLTSLASARASAEVEVVVVDDGNRERLKDSLEPDEFPFDLKIERTGGVGLNVARSRGVESAKAEFIAFLDDDVSVEAGWIEGAVSAMRSPLDLAVAGGRVLAAEPEEIPSWVSPEKLMYLSVLDLGPQQRPFTPRTSPVGANLIVRRSWLERVGGFQTGLDRAGESLLSGGETQVCHRIAVAGGRILYWPQATVLHHLDPDRLSLRWFLRRAEAQGETDAIIRYGGRSPSPREHLFELARPARAVAIGVRRLLARRSPIDAVLWLSSTRGRWRVIFAGGVRLELDD